MELRSRQRLRRLNPLQHPSIINSLLLFPTLEYLPTIHLHRSSKADRHRATTDFHLTYWQHFRPPLRFLDRLHIHQGPRHQCLEDMGCHHPRVPLQLMDNLPIK